MKEVKIMSTNALIVFKNIDGFYNCISVHWDGYIEYGVGETLYKHWTNGNEVKELCSLNREIRCFDDSMKDVEFYADDIECRRRAKKMKNLTLDEVKNKSGNYCYTYIWEEDNPGWKVLLEGSLNWELNWISEILNT